MKKNHINLFTPSLFASSIYEIIYAALFKDYPLFSKKMAAAALVVKYVRYRLYLDDHLKF